MVPTTSSSIAMGVRGVSRIAPSTSSARARPFSIVPLVPPPSGSYDLPPKALIFDSWYDPYRGVVMLVRLIDGRLEKGMRIRLMNTGGSYEI